MCDYWLSRCEGFVVRAGGRTVGVVEAVEATGPLGRAQELLVRRRRRSRVVVPAEQVLAVVPGRKELLARREPGTLRPRLRAAYATAKPVVTAVAGVVRASAVHLVRDAVALTRAAGHEARDRWRREAPRERLEQLAAELARRIDRLRPPAVPERLEARRVEPGHANAYEFALGGRPGDEQR